MTMMNLDQNEGTAVVGAVPQWTFFHSDGMSLLKTSSSSSSSSHQDASRRNTTGSIRPLKAVAGSLPKASCVRRCVSLPTRKGGSVSYFMESENIENHSMSQTTSFVRSTIGRIVEEEQEQQQQQQPPLAIVSSPFSTVDHGRSLPTDKRVRFNEPQPQSPKLRKQTSNNNNNKSPPPSPPPLLPYLMDNEDEKRLTNRYRLPFLRTRKLSDGSSDHYFESESLRGLEFLEQQDGSDLVMLDTASLTSNETFSEDDEDDEGYEIQFRPRRSLRMDR